MTAIALTAFTHKAKAQAANDATISFEKEIVPILQTHCLGCHQPAKAQGGYEMTRFANLLKGGESGDKAIVPKDVASSHLLREITPVDGKAPMPKGKNPLSAQEIESIRKWIEQGAIDDRKNVGGEVYSKDHPPIYARPPVITGIDFSADGSLLAVTGFHEALVMKTTDWTVAHRLIGVSPRVESLRFAPEGTRLAITAGRPGLSGEVQVWDAGRGEMLLSQAIGHDTLFGISWSPDSKLLAFGGADKIVRAIDAESGAQKLFQGAHEDWPRATVFSASGEHLISAGRDMSVKLTEVATERFIDNITSITPGALRGGVNALARHPQRDEVLVGGSDGSPKLYRVFRQTARQIGDDANLIRKLPDMQGRIFAVSISPDGKLMAAASTLDGKSQIRVWRYDMDGKMPDEIKAIQGKRVMNRSAAEKKKIDEYVTAEPEPVASWDVPSAAIYAIAMDAQADWPLEDRMERFAFGTATKSRCLPSLMQHLPRQDNPRIPLRCNNLALPTSRKR
ncbi:MAG: c-type cytochrome domain-containing protein [Pirellulales bacterium]